MIGTHSLSSMCVSKNWPNMFSNHNKMALAIVFRILSKGKKKKKAIFV